MSQHKIRHIHGVFSHLQAEVNAQPFLWLSYVSIYKSHLHCVRELNEQTL